MRDLMDPSCLLTPLHSLLSATLLEYFLIYMYDPNAHYASVVTQPASFNYGGEP